MEPIRKFRFREFKVYKDARLFITQLKRFSKENFPEEEKFGLTSQLWRALDSILLNIAEGSDRGTDKDFAHFLNNAHTSLNEVVACLDIALDNKYVTEEKESYFITKVLDLANQITAFRNTLINNPTK